MIWNVRPLVGLEPILIGMNPHQVGTFLDPLAAVTSRDSEQGSVVEVRTLELPFITYKDNMVCAIDTRPFMGDVLYKDINVYKDDYFDVIRRLQADNGGMTYAIGTLMFERLGILLARFLEPQAAEDGRLVRTEETEADERSLTIWQAGAFASYSDSFKPIDFS